MFDLESHFAKHKIDMEAGVCLAPYTSFRIGGACRYLVRPKSAQEVLLAIEGARKAELPFYFLGNGSNVLVSDEGYEGVILLSEKLCGMEVSDLEPGLCLLSVGAGISVSKLCSAALARGLGGLEFAWGIPGSVGGAVYMNAGAYGGEIRDVLYDCTFLDENGEQRTLLNGQLGFSYRSSFFTGKQCFILNACFALKQEDSSVVKARMDDYLCRRKTKQPLDYPSAGSVFKRPPGGYASALIEQCGLKGRRVGGAQVSEKHSGFIINTGGATCQDVLELIACVQQTVREQTGTLLECEVKTLGRVEK